MCGRFTLLARLNRILTEFRLDDYEPEQFLDYEPRYNIPPSSDVVIVRNTDGIRRLTTVRWGLIPPWTKDLEEAPMLNNARAETVAEKPSYRSAFKKRRCIIPVSGFYEWTPDGTKNKQPYYFHSPDDKIFAFAGLWETWTRDNLFLDSCTIVTTEANGVMAPIHERMPVILGENEVDRWLDPNETDLQSMLVPCPDDEITCYPVDKFVNTVKNKGKKCIERIDVKPSTLF